MLLINISAYFTDRNVSRDFDYTIILLINISAYFTDCDVSRDFDYAGILLINISAYFTNRNVSRDFYNIIFNSANITIRVFCICEINI